MVVVAGMVMEVMVDMCPHVVFVVVVAPVSIYIKYKHTWGSRCNMSRAPGATIAAAISVVVRCIKMVMVEGTAMVVVVVDTFGHTVMVIMMVKVCGCSCSGCGHLVVVVMVMVVVGCYDCCHHCHMSSL